MMTQEQWFGALAGAALFALARSLAGRGNARPPDQQPGGPQPRDPPLLRLGPDDAISMHSAFQGVLVTGGIGAGKTTGPGDEIARSLLRRGCGFHVLTAKTDEFDRWRKLCEQTGRVGDLVRFGPGGPWTCDLLDYELKATGNVESAAQLLDVLVEVSNRGQGKGDEPFWQLFAQKIFRRAIWAIWIAKGRCSLTDVYEFITSAPQPPPAVMEDEQAYAAWRDRWARRSFCAECILEAAARAEGSPHRRDIKLCADFWLVDWPGLSERTRSVGHTMATNVLDKFLSGPVAAMVSTGQTNLAPEDVHRGKVVVTDMAYETWREPGRFFQILFKLLVQRATLRRPKGPDALPVVQFADEAQVFVVPEIDAMTQALARQSRLISVALTQNLPLLYSALGGSEKARHEAEAWVANHMTKLLCANACKATNEFMSSLIGQSKQLFMNGGTGVGRFDVVADWLGTAPPQAHGGFSEQLAPELLPGEFLGLKTGAAANRFVVEFFAFQGGKRWSNGKTFIKGSVRQRISP